MSDDATPEKPRRVDPIAKANSTGIGEKLATLRVGGVGMSLGRKELAKLAKTSDGIAMMNQAPRVSADSVGPLEHMLRLVPTTRRHKEPLLHVGDPVVDFSLAGSHGASMSLESLRGTKPFAIRLTRAVGSGVI